MYIGFTASLLIMTTTSKCGLLWVCIITFWPCAMASWWFPSSYPWQNQMIIFEQKSWTRRAGPPWHMCTDNPFVSPFWVLKSRNSAEKKKKPAAAKCGQEGGEATMRLCLSEVIWLFFPSKDWWFHIYIYIVLYSYVELLIAHPPWRV